MIVMYGIFALQVHERNSLFPEDPGQVFFIGIELHAYFFNNLTLVSVIKTYMIQTAYIKSLLHEKIKIFNLLQLSNDNCLKRKANNEQVVVLCVGNTNFYRQIKNLPYCFNLEIIQLVSNSSF